MKDLTMRTNIHDTQEDDLAQMNLTGMEIAVVGLAGRFPGAENIKSYWKNLSEGIESISFFSKEEVLAAGVNEALVANPNYVRARGLLGNIDRFDAAFFGYSPKEAALMDPQHRIFLETSWQALENAGYCSKQYPGKIGVYASVGFNSYLILNMEVAPDFIHAEHGPQAMLGNDKDFIASRVSYKLHLTGPSVVVQSACSSSLVAIHQACQSLLSGEADMQLAGGITIRVPEKSGNLYQEGMINSPDGHCRAFDKDAAGTIAGNGVGVVVLKRLEDALTDRDNIYAVIKASAINNDGDDKVGYAAPSSRGQAKVIEEAQTLADVPIDSIAYIEAHGSGTKMGDPIEIEALRTAFNKKTSKKEFCAVGSVKANIGHLDAAAGVAGFIKTVLALHHKKIPPSVNFNEANPLCEFSESPFYVSTQCQDWALTSDKRRAGVSSFGMGGTNAHIILEEAPVRAASGASREWQLIAVSAKTASALDRMKDQLREDLGVHNEQPLADLAFTLHRGRRQFSHSTIVLAKTAAEALEATSQGYHEHYFNHVWDDKERLMTFMFSGQGSQHVNMARELYEREVEFRKDFDYCAAILLPLLKTNIAQIIYPAAQNLDEANALLNQTSFTQPALFVVEYCIAQQLLRWGLRPTALIGHSIGEYVAAAIAGIISLDDVLTVVFKRGQLIQRLPEGDMLFVPRSEAALAEYLNNDISIAVINTYDATVLSGDKQAIAALQARLDADNIKTKILRTSHAFHSHMMEPILDEFKDVVSRVALHAPSIPIISNVTGDWLTKEQACDPQYWVDHLRSTVKFAHGIEKLTKGAARIFLEIGPGNSLTQFTRAIFGPKSLFVALASQPAATENQDAQFALLRVLGRAWQYNFDIDWAAFYAGQERNRLSLSSYPFQGDSYWVNFGNKTAIAESNAASNRSKFELLWTHSWEQHQFSAKPAQASTQALVLGNTFNRTLPAKLAAGYANLNVINLDDYHNEFETLFSTLELDLKQPLDVYFLADLSNSAQLHGFINVLGRLASLVSQSGVALKFSLLVNSVFDVFGGEPKKSTMEPGARVLQLMSNLLPSFHWRIIDLGENSGELSRCCESELFDFSHEAVAAFRNGGVWRRRFKVYPTPQPEFNSLDINTYLCLGLPNQFIAQLVINWHKLTGGAFVFLMAEAVPPSQWASFAESGGSEYAALTAMLNAGVDVRTRICELTEPSALNDLVADFSAMSTAILDCEALTRQIDLGDVFTLTKTDLEKLISRAEMRSNLLSNLESQGRIAWHLSLAFQSAIMSYPEAVQALLQTSGVSSCHRLVYVNEDFFGNNLYQDWMQRLSHEDRLRQLHNVIGIKDRETFVWLNPALPQDYRWSIQRDTHTLALDVSGDENQGDSGLYKRPELSVPYSAPITDRQKIICAIWKEMFQVDKVGIHDDFFELGGDSVMALKLLSALELAFNVGLPLSEVINSPNVAAQANAIVEFTELPMDQRKVSPLVALQSKGSKPAFFCVHPAGGIIHCYIEMSRILGKDQPFYAFQHPGIDGKSGPYVTYPKMAELYIESMLEIQPKGPYFLGGWSFGGTLAYEMAMQLLARGEEVAMLALFDSPSPSSLYRLKGRPEFEFAGMLAFLSQALGTMFGADIQVSVDDMRKIPPEQQLDYILQRAVVVSGDSEMGNAKEALERIVDIFEVCDVGERDYEPGRYPQNIHMYRVQDLDDYEFTGYKEHPQLESATFGWDELCDGDVLVRFVPGTHISMIFPPNVNILTEKFKLDLDKSIIEVAARSANSVAVSTENEGYVCAP
jgi:phthiocerol/phenolphthiocerol synthesis type-I polyketide synthase E